MNQTNEWLEGDLSFEGQELKKKLLERGDMDELLADTIVRCPKDVYERLSKERKEGKLKLETPATGGVLKTGKVEPIEKIVDSIKEE